MSISRRNFLSGSAACAVAAALPVLPGAAPVMWSRNVTPPIFEGAIGVYDGVVVRDFYDLNACAREGLWKWARDRGQWEPCGASTMEWIECDGDS